jgi:hypothetical protein
MELQLRMNNILMIAFQYPPFGESSGVQRTLKFSSYLRGFGWHPVVLTAHPRAYSLIRDEQLREIPANVPVERTFALDAARHLSIGGRYPRWLALPDRWVNWWLGAVPHGLRLIRKYRPAAMWSTYPIATAHLVGLTLQRVTGIPWVADFRDPMTDTDRKTGTEYPLDPHIRKANRRVERLVVRHCRYAVFTTPSTLRMYKERYPEIPESRWRMIGNGYDEENFLAAEKCLPRRSSSSGGVVLVHSGALHPSIRDPLAFFAVLADLRRTGLISSKNFKVILRASGNEEYYRQHIRACGIGDIVSLEPPVPYRDALKEMLSADGLLIFQGSNCNLQIPGKIYEYLRARRPIFAMTDPDGDTAGVLKAAGIGTIVPLDSKVQIAHGLCGFLKQLREDRSPVAGDTDISAYSRRSRTLQLAELLDALVKCDQ